MKKLNLKPITELKFETLRIWRFPGGGSILEQMLEFNKSGLIFHSYLLEGFENKLEFSQFDFSRAIREKEIIRKLESIISESNFMETKDSEKYCEPFWGCADLYFVEFTNGEEINKFIIDYHIESCNNEKAINSKRIFRTINQIIKKYSS